MTTTNSIIVLSQSALMVFPLEMQLRDNCVHVHVYVFVSWMCGDSLCL